jgi:phosphate-selective porin OprO and OprP
MTIPKLLSEPRVFFRVCVLASLLASSGNFSLGSEGSTVEERLALLEAQMMELKAENEVLKQALVQSKASNPQDIVKTRPAEASAPSQPAVEFRTGGKSTKFVVGGFIQALGESGGAPDSRYQELNDRVYLRRARINMTASFAEHFTGRLEVDYGANSIRAGSGVRGQVTDGFIQWNRYPAARVTLGQFKTPFGFEQLASDTRLLTIERALSNDRLTVSRQIGLGLAGDLSGKRLAYSMGLFNGNGVNTGVSDNDAMMYAGRLSGQLFRGTVSGASILWNAGVNGFTSKDRGSFVGTRSGFGVDTQLTAGPLYIQAEWLMNQHDPDAALSVDSQGYSLLAGYNFDDQWRTAVRYDHYDSNIDASGTATDLWTLGVDYRIKGDDIKLSLNYLWGDQPANSGYEGRWVGRLQLIF